MKEKSKVNYKISLYQSRFLGYQTKNNNFGKITLYISTIWKYSQNIEHFIQNLIHTLIVERICLERGFNKIRMKNRCIPFKDKFGCKMDYIAYKMINYD